MGCCYSLCKEEVTPQEGTVNERTHLLEDPVRNEPAPLRPVRSTVPSRKPDEQSALNRILQETASNVIDVGALGSHALEAHEYNERVKLYQARLGQRAPVAGPPVPHVAPPKHKLLRDISNPERLVVLAQEPIKPQDIDLIENAVKKAAAAISELRVEHREDLVVPFRIP